MTTWQAMAGQRGTVAPAATATPPFRAHIRLFWHAGYDLNVATSISNLHLSKVD